MDTNIWQNLIVNYAGMGTNAFMEFQICVELKPFNYAIVNVQLIKSYLSHIFLSTWLEIKLADNVEDITVSKKNNANTANRTSHWWVELYAWLQIDVRIFRYRMRPKNIV